jgi:hypothetical protein
VENPVKQGLLEDRPKTLPAGNARKWGPKNPYKQAIKNPNRYSI